MAEYKVKIHLFFRFVKDISTTVGIEAHKIRILKLNIIMFAVYKIRKETKDYSLFILQH